MGKEIPEIEMPVTASKEDKIRAAAKVSLPKVTFVGGNRLNTTDEGEESPDASQSVDVPKEEEDVSPLATSNEQCMYLTFNIHV